MPRVGIAVIVGLLLSSLAWGAPCVTGSAVSYALLGSTGCTITTPFGVVTLNNFFLAVSTNGGLDAGTILNRLALSPFSVLDRTGFYAYETDGNGNQANLSVAASQSLTITIDYDVSAASPEVILRYGPGAIAGRSGDAIMSVKKETTTPSATGITVSFGGAFPATFNLPPETAVTFLTFGSPLANFHMRDTVTMTGNTGSATLHDFANIFVAGFPPCPGHTTHGHLPGPGDGHNVLSFHDHAGTHGHIAQFGGCPTHAFGHTAGLRPEEEGTLLPTLNAAVNQDGTANSDPSLRQFAQPAQRGSVVTLYGPADGFQEGDAVEAFVGETPARVLSSGPQPGAPGTWMVQVEVPADALVGPASHVRVISGGREVQAVDIAVN